MLRKSIPFLFVIIAGCLILFWWLTLPLELSKQQLEMLTQGDAKAGENVFWTGGCGSCHSEKSAKGDEKTLLGGGHRLQTPAGIFVTPNISPDGETGIGKWSLEEFANAMWNGVSPKGEHYYPSFPYESYASMSGKDISDLFAFLKTLQPVSRSNEAHELALPFKLRRGVGIWKHMFMSAQMMVGDISEKDGFKRGRYLVEGPGHCGQCHTRRNLFGFGAMDQGRWLGGGPSPDGNGFIPNITSDETGIAGWSMEDIVYYLESGFTPDFDSVGATMVSVQENMARLSAKDREAIAIYLKEIPAVEK